MLAVMAPILVEDGDEADTRPSCRSHNDPSIEVCQFTAYKRPLRRTQCHRGFPTQDLNHQDEP